MIWSNFSMAASGLPEYLLDALLDWGIHVTLVKSDDLLVFRHVREHQSFHTGQTRKAILYAWKGHRSSS
jgi:hypothetical protein